MSASLDPFASASKLDHGEVVGSSTQGRAITIHRGGADDCGPRVLLVGGQHGDESLARGAVNRFLQTVRATNRTIGVQLAAIADLNPDGHAARTRRNAAGIDLNRDHQRLHAVETRLLHQLVRRWRPDLIVDVHTYPSRRKHLLQRGWAYCHDVFLDLPNNPALPASMRRGKLNEGMHRVMDQLREEGFLADRYLLVRRSGRVRHSTADVVDARNQFALRYGIPVILVEGKQPRRAASSSARRRTRQALVRTLQHIVDWAAANGTGLAARPTTLADHPRVAVGCRYQPADAPARLLLEQVDSGQPKEVELPGRYTPTLRATQYARLPDAYAVPTALAGLNQLLAAHGFQSGSVASAPGHRPPRLVQQYMIENCVLSRRPDRAARQVSLATRSFRGSLAGYTCYGTDQRGGSCLAVLLEPNSKYGLARYGEYGLSLRPGDTYPILRCEG